MAYSWHLNVQRLKQDSLDSSNRVWFEKAGDRVKKRASKENGSSGELRVNRLLNSRFELPEKELWKPFRMPLSK